MKSLISSYAMAATGFILPPLAGLHRFYLGRPVSGLIYCMTGGFLGMGTLFDMLFLIPQMVDQENRRLAGKPEHPQLAAPSFVQPMANPFFFMDDPVRTESAEKQILKAAEKRGGTLTVQMMALDTDLSLEEAKVWQSSCGKRATVNSISRRMAPRFIHSSVCPKSPWCWIDFRASSRLVCSKTSRISRSTHPYDGNLPASIQRWRLCRFGSRTAA